MSSLNKLKNFFLENISMLIFVFLLTKFNILLNLWSRVLVILWYNLISKETNEGLRETIKSARFGIDFKDLSLDSLVLLQETWIVLFLILNLLLLYYFRNMEVSLVRLKNTNFIKEIKENKIYFFFILLISYMTIFSILHSEYHSFFYTLKEVPCLNLDVKLLEKLDLFMISRRSITSIYFLITLLIFALNKEKSLFISCVTWFLLWFILRSMNAVSDITFDVSILLFLEGIAPVRAIIQEINTFSSIQTVSNMEDQSKKIDEALNSLDEKLKKVDEIIDRLTITEKKLDELATKIEPKREPCSFYRDALVDCSRNLSSSTLKDVVSYTSTGAGHVETLANRSLSGECQEPIRRLYDECMKQEKKKK